MNRVLYAALCCAALLLCLHARAQAEVELCPAGLATAPVGGQSGPANLYGFDLRALGPRTVQATLAFDTNAGWYTADVPATTLAEKDRHYTSISAEFVRHDFVSPVMYVRFPAAVTIAHEWVYQATARNDGPFGWASRGAVTCDAPAGAHAHDSGNQALFPKLDPKDSDALDATPAPQSIILAATPSKPLGDRSCPDPFDDATATHAAVPTYPVGMRGIFASSTIEVAVGPDGLLMDAWVWGPSGYGMMDQSALDAAKASTYKAGRAYCRNVPGLYLFRVTYRPN